MGFWTEIQKYLRLHVVSGDFATTVTKARHFMDASELSRTAKKPTIRATSPSVSYQAIYDKVMDAFAEVNAVQAPNPTLSLTLAPKIGRPPLVSVHRPPVIRPLEVPATLQLLVFLSGFRIR